MTKRKLKGLEYAAELGRLADKANEHHYEAQKAWRGALDHARHAGEALLRAKRLKGGRGKWGRWVDQRFDGSRETARVYMRIARHWKGPLLTDARNQGIKLMSIQAVLNVLRRKTKQGVEAAEEEDQHPPEADILRQEIRAHFAAYLRQRSLAELRMLDWNLSDWVHELDMVGEGRGLLDQFHQLLKDLVCRSLDGHYYGEDETAKRKLRRRICRAMNRGERIAKT